MAGPAPRDDYNPVPTVQPSGAPNDYLSVRSNPNQFGAQVGEATQKLGATTEQTGTQAVDYGIQALGLANEHAANMADMDLAVQGGKVYDQYKQLEGLDAANSKDKAVSDYLAVNNQIRQGLTNPAAQRAYDQIATRRMSFTIQDMNSYAADQTKVAYRKGNASGIQLSIDQANRLSVATDDKQSGFELGTMKFNLNTAFTAPGYGLYQNVPASTQADGTLKFADTPEGKIAQNDYDNQLNQYTGKFWSTRIMTVAQDVTGQTSVLDAYKLLTDNRDKMPAATYQELQAKLAAPLNNERSRSDVDGLLGDAHAEYLNNGGTQGSASSPNNIGNVKLASGGFADPVTPRDGVVLATNNLRGDLYKGLTLAEIGKKWEGTTPDNIQKWVSTVSKMSGVDPTAVPNLSDPNTLNRVVKGIMQAEKSPGDQKLFTDDTINSGVQDSLSGAKANLSSSPSGTVYSRGYQSPVDYMSLHEPELIQQARDLASKKGYDATVQDLYAQRMETRINEMRSAQTGEVRAYTDNIVGKVTDEKNPIVNMTTLDNSTDPDTRNAWVQLQALNPYARQTVQNLVQAQASGKSRTYGTDFYSHLQSVLNGQVKDPTSLSGYIGGDRDPISASGFTALQKEAQAVQTPQGQAFAKDEVAFFKKMHDMTTGAGVFPGANNAAGEARMNTFLISALPQIQAARAAGKSAGDLFDDKSPDYVGKSLKVPDYGTIMREVSGELISKGGAPVQNGPQSYTSLSDLQQAVRDKKITRSDATNFALQKKWIQPNPPPVPKPDF